MVATDLLVDLGSNTIVFRDESVSLSPQETEFMFVLRDAWPRTVDYEVMADRVWGMTDDRETTIRRQHLAVIASKTRTKIRTLTDDVAIESTNGRGFRLVIQQER